MLQEIQVKKKYVCFKWVLLDCDSLLLCYSVCVCVWGGATKNMKQEQTGDVKQMSDFRFDDYWN